MKLKFPRRAGCSSALSSPAGIHAKSSAVDNFGVTGNGRPSARHLMESFQPTLPNNPGASPLPSLRRAGVPGAALLANKFQSPSSSS